MKILAIGNSFSQDATAYIERISGHELYVRNLYIPGYSLDRHCSNIESGEAIYQYQKDAKKLRMISLDDALCLKKWDFITLQQVSHLSGIIDSYEPYMSILIDHIHKVSPDAKIALHETWAYDTGSDHPGFVNYNRSQKVMYGKIKETTDQEAKKYSLPIIKTGDAVQKIRSIKEFDCRNGGRTLCRDTFHLSYDYGRYLAGLVWYEFFTGKKAADINYRPKGTIKKLCDIIKENI
jgi:hypothetical protein